MTAGSPVDVWLEAGGRLVRLRLARPKANVIDGAVVAALGRALDEHLGRPELSALLIDAEGPHFSFGASVEEHLPDRCADMLKNFHALIFRLLESPVPALIAVRGQCLGGGLELALAGTLIFASPDAQFGQPEIKLGVIAPAASCLLPERIGLARAEDMLLSGRSLTAMEAHGIGLVHAVAEDPVGAAVAWFNLHLAEKSSASLRYAVRAARADLAARVRAKLTRIEGLYLDELMSTRDAVEGLNAFLAKRPAKWEHR